MINIFGKVMVYVEHPEKVADFWINKIGFVQIEETMMDEKVLSVEISPSKYLGTSLVLFNKKIIEVLEPELILSTPSILFGTYNIQELNDDLKSKGVKVGEIVESEGVRTFNFPDTEGNYFAVSEVAPLNF